MENKKNTVLKGILTKLIAVAVVAILVVAYVYFSEGTGEDKPEYVSKIDTAQYVEATKKLDGAIGDYRLVAKSDSHELYLKDETLAIKVKDLKTGEVMDSTVDQIEGKANETWTGFMQSGITVNLIKGNDDSIVADLINSKHSVKVTDLENGFKAEVDFTDICIAFTMYVTLEGNDVVIAIPDNTIEQYGNPDGGKYYVVESIVLYPFLGSTHLGDEEGYMFIPDGSGAIIKLDDKEGRYATGYSEPVYGDDAGFRDTSVETLLWEEIPMITDAEKILAPIYGMVHTDRQMGYLAIIEEGDQRATIDAAPNGASIDYNRIFASFVFNRIYIEPTNNGNTGTIKRYENERTHMDIKLRFSFVSGDDADYTGLAIAYREYLLDNGLVKADLDTSYNTRVDFMGTERENWLTTTKAVTMTTIDEIREIYDELEDANVTDILTVYKGWQDGGIQDVPITEYDADSEIGGTDELTKLIKELESTDIKFSLYQESLLINPDESNTTFDVIKRNNKRLFEEKAYMDVYKIFKYMTPEKCARVLKDMAEEYTDEGVSDITIAGITNNLFSYYYNGTYFTRPETADMFESAVKEADEYMDIMLEQPFAYLWKYTDVLLDMPASSSDYIFEDGDVPFYAIALKGIVPMYSEYVNFEANKKEFFLRLVETGVYPSFYITYKDSSELIYTNSADIYSSKYSVYKQEIINYANELSALAAKTEGAMISDHERVGNDLVIVTYSNGIKVYVNYAETPVEADGITIDALSYKVGE